ncbi:MAG: FtsX-like permease family protein [Thermomicrobiales bacterium]
MEDLRSAPLARGLASSFRLSVALAAIYGGMVVIVALVLTSRERARDLGYLRTLGLDSRQALGMTLTETVPGILLSCGLGVPLGIAIARLAEPGLDLRAFVGPDVQIAVLVDRPTAIAVAAGLAIVALLSIAVFSFLARRIQLGEVLRVGD